MKRIICYLTVGVLANTLGLLNMDEAVAEDSPKRLLEASSLESPSLYIVGSRLKEDAEFCSALKEFEVKSSFVDEAELLGEAVCSGDDADGESNRRQSSYRCPSRPNDRWFVVAEFDSDVYNAVRRITPRVFGSIAIIQFGARKVPLPLIARPLFCISMANVVVCFTGFRRKEELTSLIQLVHHMGGSIRKDFSTSVTHLVANSTSGEKYFYAVSLGKPIMSPEWIFKCWEKRNGLDFSATDPDMVQFKVRPFLSCVFAFVGFSDDEKQHMEDLASSNGGRSSELGNADVTHVVVDDQSVEDVPPQCVDTIFVVKSEWFWASIQMDARADEFIYQPKSIGENGTVRGTPVSAMTPNSRARKRKRLKDTLGQLASLSDIDSQGNSPASLVAGAGTKQRRSSELRALSMSPSLLDATVSPFTGGQDGQEEGGKGYSDVSVTIGSPCGTLFKTPIDLKGMSARHRVCHELLQTEINYVKILHTIISLIKAPVEDPDQVGGPLLDPTEVRMIFGNVPPIYEVHRQLRDDLFQMNNSWKEENSVGEIILKYSQDFLKAYPPFVNYFEKTKETILRCDSTKPRFHAFLKICQKKSECGRQSLVELLIRPVQRLPSVILLLNDIVKHTGKSNPDQGPLEEAVKCLKDVLMLINEDKRKTEGQLAMFCIVNDIENCPPNLLSSHRSFITKADMIELSDGISGKGDNVTMFLFTDVVEVCKKRKGCCGSAGLTSSSGASGGGLPLVARSPSMVSLHSVRTSQKPYKHLELMPLCHIKRVVDIKETDDCRNVFALICRSAQDVKERLYSFTLVFRENEAPSSSATGDNGSKITFLRTLCRQMATTICKPDLETFMTSLEPHHLDIMSSDIGSNTLSKAMSRFASKTSKKVGRAFSFTKSPRRLSRAMSTMISPLITSGPTSASPLQGYSKKFPCASTTNLHLLESPSRSVSCTPTVGRKPKSFTIGPSSAAKRL